MDKLSKEEIHYTKWKQPVKPVFQNQMFSLLENEDYHVVEYHTQQVIFLPILEKDRVVMPKVFRKILGTAVWKLPVSGVQKMKIQKKLLFVNLGKKPGFQLLIFQDLSRKVLS